MLLLPQSQYYVCVNMNAKTKRVEFVQHVVAIKHERRLASTAIKFAQMNVEVVLRFCSTCLAKLSKFKII